MCGPGCWCTTHGGKIIIAIKGVEEFGKVVQGAIESQLDIDGAYAAFLAFAAQGTEGFRLQAGLGDECLQADLHGGGDGVGSWPMEEEGLRLLFLLFKEGHLFFEGGQLAAALLLSKEDRLLGLDLRGCFLVDANRKPGQAYAEKESGQSDEDIFSVHLQEAGEGGVHGMFTSRWK